MWWLSSATHLQLLAESAAREQVAGDPLSPEPTGGLLEALARGAGFIEPAAMTVRDQSLLETATRRLAGRAPVGE